MKRMALASVACGMLAATSWAQVGPDVIVGDLPNVQKWGSLVVGADTITAYSVGTTSCNSGTQTLDWYQESSLHPVIAQTIYRVSPNGRLQQIGMGYLKHGFCALQQSVCGACTPFCGGCCVELGVGCSDPYSSSLNGDQGNLGPHTDINPFTGVFPWPFTSRFATGNVIYKRIQVNNNDLNPALNPGAQYFTASQYVARDDAASNNALNNYSYRRITVGALSGTPAGYALNVLGGTVRTQTPIQAWVALTGLTTPPGPAVNLRNLDVPGEGRFQMGYAVTSLGGGQWRYNYAVLNINSHRGGQAFRVPAINSVNVISSFFHDVNYHSQGVSGVPTYDNTNWAFTKVETPNGFVQWAGSAFVTGLENALRWDTTYTFEFVADAPPVPATVTLNLYRAGSPSSVTASAVGPRAVGDINCDGIANFDDITPFVELLTGAAGCDRLNGDTDFDGDVDFDDITGFVNRLI